VTTRVLHLAGSAVSEFLADLSRLYAQDCLAAAADPARYEFHVAYVTPGGQWRFPADLSREAIRAAAPVPLAVAVRRLAALRPDLMLPQMFCLPGMTSYRALFDVLGVPYVGSPPGVMALGAHKAHAKAVVAAAGVRVPPGEVLRPGGRPSLTPPVVVKPVDGDNSLGVTLVRDWAGYEAALDAAFAHSDEALVESFVELGREVRCGIVVTGGELVCLPLEEYNVSPGTRPIREYADKISRNGRGDLSLVAKDASRAWIVDPGDPVTQRVWAAARRCHAALGCRDYSLFDFRIDPAGQPWFLEAGLYCSFARQSVIPVMAAAAGISLPELFELAIRESTSRLRLAGDSGPAGDVPLDDRPAGVGPPLVELHHAGRHEVQPVEEAHGLRVGAAGLRRLHVLVVLPRAFGDDIGVDVGRGMGEGQVAARRGGRDGPGHDPVRVLIVGDQVQHADEEDGDRLAEVERLGRLLQDRRRVLQVGVQVGAGAFRRTGQQRPGVREHDGIVVHVDDPAFRGHRLRDLVGVVGRRDPGAQVEELPDPALRDEVADRAAEEFPVGPDVPDDRRPHGDDGFGRRLVGREVVLAAQPVVVDAGGMRHRRVEAGVK
jgi:D-alanine-D-alanine ligase